MKCTNCGSKNRQGVQFCEECGQSLNQAPSVSASGETCQTCGHTNRTGVRFCEECGANLNIAMEVRPKPIDSFNCPKCKHANPTDFRFCEECGANLSIPAQAESKTAGQLTCPNCRHLNPANFSFCEECGNPLMGMMQRPILQSRASTVQFWKKTLLVSSFIGGTILILFVAGIVILGPRASNPPAFIINNIPPTERQIMDAPTVAAPVSESTVYPSTEEVAGVEPAITEPAIEQPAQSSSGSGCTDRANLITETIGSGTSYPPQTGFTKTWVIENTGTCTWTTNYTINFTGGEQMEAKASQNLQNEVQPNQRIMIAVDMVAPATNGNYHGEWFLKNASGVSFGWGSNAITAFEVSINVSNEVALALDPGLLDPSSEIELPARGGGITPPDTDADGLNDWDEDWFANTFLPYVEYDVDEDEKREDIMRFYQVTPIYKTYPEMALHREYIFPGYDGPPGVLITYVYTYKWDTGDPYLGIEDHAGDAEMIRVFLVNPRNEPYNWIPTTIIIPRHGLDPALYFNGQYYGNTPQQWINGTHIKIYVSEDKHAMYVYHDECENYAVGYVLLFEECGGGYILDTPIVSQENGFNVGERNIHPFTRVPNNTRNLYTTEFVWSGADSMLPIYDASNNMNIIGTYDASNTFCGGFNDMADFDPFGYGPPCGGGMNKKWWPSPDSNNQRAIEYSLSQSANRFYKSQYGEQYEICFLTDPAYMAGTDFHVDITLVGASSTLSSQNMFNITRGLESLESKGFDCFNAGAYDMNDDIAGIQIYVYGDSDYDSEWLLNDVAIRDLFSNEAAMVFSCHCWIDNTSAYDADIGQNTIGPSIYIPITP